MKENRKTHTGRAKGQRASRWGRFLLTALFLLLALSLGACGGGEESSPVESGAASGASEGIYDYEGCFSDFTTLNLEGEEVTEALFAEHEYTIIDVWATYCGPCIQSMPDLAALYDRYEEKGLGVVGILTDAQDEDLEPIPSMVEVAKELEEEAGVRFPCLLMSMDLAPFLMDVSVIPAYLIVDSEGRPACELIVGAKSPEDWEAILRDLGMELE